MNDQEKCIKLAEAMGANLAYLKDETDILYQWPDGRRTKQFNPFKDANDDYAVLEWMRKEYMRTSFHWMKFREALYLLNHETDSDYLIGNNARATLKVIE